MNAALKTALENKQSRANADNIVKLFQNNAFSLEELFLAIEMCEEPYSQRAAWPMGIILAEQPQSGLPFIYRMFKLLDKKNHPSVRRLIMGYFAIIQIPEDLEGPLYDKCFAWVTDLSLPATIPIFSMQIMYNIGLKYPELHDELYLIIKDLMPFAKGGVYSRSKKIKHWIEVSRRPF